MTLTGVTGKELSNCLHFDMSLISRWKNGNRKIRNEAYLSELSDFFYRYREGGFIELYCTLTNTRSRDASEVISAIGSWLSSPIAEEDFLAAESLKDSRRGQTYMTSYQGNAGRRQGVMELLATVISVGGQGKIYLISQEDMSWLTEEAEFSRQWASAMMRCIQLGYEIYIIHSIRRSMQELNEAFIQWVPFYMTGKVHAYYLAESKSMLPVQTLFIVENMLLCEGNCFTGDMDERFTMLTNDVISIQNRQNCYQLLLDQATKLNDIFRKDSMPQIINSVITVGANKEDSLFKAEELFFSTMKISLLQDILEANAVDDSIKELCVKFHQKLSLNFNQNVAMFSNKHIYNLSTLIEQAESGNFKGVLLSIIAGQEIYINSKQFVEHIQSTIERLKTNPKYEIGLYLTQNTHLPLEELDFWVKEGYYLTMWSKRSYEFIQVSTEPTMIEIIKRFYKQLWEMIPLVDKDKEHVIEHLEKLIIVAENTTVK